MGTNIALFFGIIDLLALRAQGIAFENCNDGFTPHGDCKTIEKDGAIGSESANSVLMNNGYLDFGKKSGCPYGVDSCQDGFNFYGWVKFLSYPSTCSQYGVVVSTDQFNIHVLGNGHLGVYVWMENDREWYAETVQPVILNVYYPIVMQYYHDSKTEEGSIQLIMQDQLSAIQNCSRPRTYKPPTSNFVFAGDGVSGNFANVQLDRINLDGPVSSTDLLVGKMMDVNARQQNCLTKPRSILTRSFTCFWLESTSVGWSGSYKACNSTSYDAGYPYGRLARFPTDNITVWKMVAAKIAAAGSDPSNGFFAWMGGGSNGQWLNAAMTPVDAVAYPPDVAKNGSQANGGTCMALNTKTSPWQWVDMDCSSTAVKNRLCEMSWDCLLINPCKNLGACHPVTDGPTCTCFGTTSGKYCENALPRKIAFGKNQTIGMNSMDNATATFDIPGILAPTCVNNCLPCTTTPILKCSNRSTTTSSTMATTIASRASVSISSIATLPTRRNAQQQQPVPSPVVVAQQPSAQYELEIVEIIEEYDMIIEKQSVEILEIQTLLSEHQVQYDVEFDKRTHEKFEEFWKEKKTPGRVGEIRLHGSCKKMLMMQVNDRIIEELSKTMNEHHLQTTKTIEQRRNDIATKEKNVQSRNSFRQTSDYFEQTITTSSWQQFYETIYMAKSSDNLVSKQSRVINRGSENLDQSNQKNEDHSTSTSKDQKQKNRRHKGKRRKQVNKSHKNRKWSERSTDTIPLRTTLNPQSKISGGGGVDINGLVNGLTNNINNQQIKNNQKKSSETHSSSHSGGQSLSSSSHSESKTVQESSSSNQRTEVKTEVVEKTEVVSSDGKLKK